MGWMEIVGDAIQYIEEHITEDITPEIIAGQVNVSPFYFQKGFAMLCGFTLGEYIRCRKLALAGSDLAAGNEKVIDIALKYGYDSPDSFTKAFTRFHGVTPSQVRRETVMLRSFAPLKISFSLKGGYLMDYKIEKKEAFTVIASAKTFPYEGAQQLIPMFWGEHYKSGRNQTIMGMYGICIDYGTEKDNFEYLIADPCSPDTEVPDGFTVKTVPEFTWAIFPCKGAMPDALQTVNNKIYSEWLPAVKEYEIAAGYCVEYYDDASKYPNGTQDENYYSEVWIPVKKK
ncbi:MAG: effector binding domain-containing protein [Ruminococcus sp.]